MRRLGLVLVLALLGGLSVAVPGAQAGTTVRKLSKEIDVTVGPAGHRTVCTVVFDLYRPSTATRKHRKPAILTTNGFGGSDCKITLDDPDWDGLAAKQLVTYLGGGKRANDGTSIRYVARDRVSHDGVHRKHDPRVGMVGGSYGGQVQFAVAGIDPRVDTIVPIITWNDLSYSLAPNNTDPQRGVTYRTPGTEKVGWTSLFFGVGIADGIQHASTDPTRNTGCPNFTDQACVAKAQMDALGYPTQDTLDFARHASVTSYLSKVRIPTLLLQGQNDTLFNLQEAVATYRGLRAQGTTVKMVWQSWGHSGGTPAPGELDMAKPGSSYEGKRVLHWFARYLKDKDVSTGPRFSYFRDWVSYNGIATPAYGTSRRYPVGRKQSLYLSGSDQRVTDKAAVTGGSATYANLAGEAPLSYSEVSALQGGAVPDGGTPPYDTPGSFASWTTPPLSSPVESVGVATLRLRLSSPVAEQTQAGGAAGQLLLFAKIYDVAPDGTRTLVHRLSVVVAATDAAYRNNKVVQPVSVLTSPDDPGVLRLPVLGGGV